MIQHATLLVVFLFLLGGGLGLPLPEDLTLLAAGAAAHEQKMHLPWLMLVGYLGVSLPDWVIYLAGRRYGQDIVSHPHMARLFSADRLAMVRSAVEHHGARAVFLARFLLGFRIVPFLAAGTFRVPILKFALGEAAGTIIFVPAMITLGYLFADRAERVLQNVTRVQHWLEVLGIVGVALYLGLRAWTAKRGLGD